jgi:hypothetical protein
MLYDVSASGYHAEDIDAWWYDEFPECSPPVQWPIQTGLVIPDPQDFDVLCSHPLGDAVTATLSTGTPPTGLNLVANVLGSGDTIADMDEDEDGVLLTYDVTSDVSGSSVQQLVTPIPINTLAAPDCTTSATTQSECEDSFNTTYFNTNTFNAPTSSGCTPGTASGIVTAQVPAASAEAELFSAVDLELTGSCGSGVGGKGVSSFPFPFLFTVPAGFGWRRRRRHLKRQAA